MNIDEMGQESLRKVSVFHIHNKRGPQRTRRPGAFLRYNPTENFGI